MHRRDVLALTAAVTLAPWPRAARAEGAQAYSPDLLEAELAAGKTVFLDFKASWCSTCAAQGRVLAELKAENPDYQRRITFIDVDWDTWKDDMIVADLNIPRRSTLVLLRGEQELGRLVAQTGKAQIKALLDLGLQAGA